MLPLSLDIPRVYVAQRIVEGLRLRGVQSTVEAILPGIDDEWFESVRVDAGGGLLTVRHPALLRAIDAEVESLSSVA